ncbi:hypothetical protein GCM10023149_52160 [Mucilaginibacter gynuensis]|uniref:BLUF domain-containing protein n=1 Tax=Mucilaginibacter gynuensis TaxID=1302236 RepID=A0ABP8HKF2_9SPHI
MNYLIYVSTATKLLSEYELTDLLTESRDLNARDNITGMLLYAEGTFIQVLEGEQHVVSATFNRIEQDSRHKNIILLTVGTISNRNFPSWTMGFMSANADILSEFSGYINPAQIGFLNGPDGSKVIKLLKSFAQDNKMNTGDLSV